MSKAFTKESDGADEDDEPPSAAAGGREELHHAGRLRAAARRIAALLDVERPKVVETVSWAAGNGDRSENGDYIYGKKRLREIDRRIRFLAKRLEIAEVVDPRAHHGATRSSSAPPSPMPTPRRGAHRHHRRRRRGRQPAGR